MLHIFLIHLSATAVMTGLIMTIQFLHYPFFHHLRKKSFAKQMQVHRTRISFIVIPVMLLELITGFYLMMYSTSNVYLFFLGFLMIGLIWLSTFLLQMPRHVKISDEYSVSEVNRLIYTNWIRTVIWPARLLLLLFIAVQDSFFNSF